MCYYKDLKTVLTLAITHPSAIVLKYTNDILLCTKIEESFQKNG